MCVYIYVSIFATMYLCVCVCVCVCVCIVRQPGFKQFRLNDQGLMVFLYDLYFVLDSKVTSFYECGLPNCTFTRIPANYITEKVFFLFYSN